METSFYKNPKTCHLAVHLLLSAAWKDHETLLDGKITKIMRGQIVCGRNSLAESTGLSPQNIRTCLQHLTKCHFLTIESTKQYSIITICKYGEYQQQQPTCQPSNQPTTNQAPTNDQPLQNKGNKDISNTPLPPNGERRPRKELKSKSQIPDPFLLTEEMRTWFNEQGFKFIEVRSATAEFVDYWRGKGVAMKDWVATWRNGMRQKERWSIERGQKQIVAQQILTPKPYEPSYVD